MKPRREITKKSVWIQLRMRNHDKDKGQGFFAGIARVIHAIKQSVLPDEFDIVIGQKEVAGIEEVDAPAFDRRNEYLETKGLEQAQAALATNAHVAEHRALERGGDPSDPEPFDPIERQRAAESVREEICRLQALGYSITFKPEDLQVELTAEADADFTVFVPKVRTLADELAVVLKGKTLSVSDAAEAVKARGYATNTDNLRAIVNRTLIRDRRFQRVSRGHYTVN